MKEKPILLNGDMVRAVLNGSKTQTRRNLGRKTMELLCCAAKIGEISYAVIDRTELENNDLSYIIDFCPFGKVGDRLYVRERMRVNGIKGQIGIGATHVGVRYEADGAESDFIEWPDRLKEKPVLGKCLSNGGPREFSRITLEITGVMVERLQDISEEDARAEGVEQIGSNTFRNYKDPEDCPSFLSATSSFISLWKSIYGTWEQNPWVWVIEFKVVNK